MTKDEIKTLIAEKISGQGNQVDIGGALADVLNGIVDSLGNISRGKEFDFGSNLNIDTDTDSIINQWVTDFNDRNGTNFASPYEFAQYFVSLFEDDRNIWAKSAQELVANISMRLTNFFVLQEGESIKVSMLFGAYLDSPANGYIGFDIVAYKNPAPDQQYLQVVGSAM